MVGANRSCGSARESNGRDTIAIVNGHNDEQWVLEGGASGHAYVERTGVGDDVRVTTRGRCARLANKNLVRMRWQHAKTKSGNDDQNFQSCLHSKFSVGAPSA